MSYKVRSWSAHELLGIGVADICATCFPDGKHQGVPGQKVLGPGGVLHLENGCSEVRSRLPDLSRTAAALEAYDRGEVDRLMETTTGRKARKKDDMEDWQQRVVDEKEALDGNIGRLDEFLKGEMIKQLPADEQSRMLAQIGAMLAYSYILGQRIDAAIEANAIWEATEGRR